MTLYHYVQCILAFNEVIPFQCIVVFKTVSRCIFTYDISYPVYTRIQSSFTLYIACMFLCILSITAALLLKTDHMFCTNPTLCCKMHGAGAERLLLFISR